MRDDAAKPARLPRRALHGVLLLDKPLGWSSNDALQKVKGLLRAQKAGHTGTLDPLATGLLPLCFGAATKFAQVSLDADKHYEATLQLGECREGGDREGAVISRAPVHVQLADISAACAAFTGAITQTPPMQSALKVDGRALYTYARQGQTVAREPRAVTIHALEVLTWVPELALLTLGVRCSKGTYVRTLAEDIGTHLGCGAHLAALRRTGSGALNVAAAITLDALQAMPDEARLAHLMPPDCLLADWPLLQLPETEAARFLAGQRRRVNLPDAPQVRVYGPEPHALLGSAHLQGGELIADRLLSPPEVAALLMNPYSRTESLS
ncbi:MAG: tRNA pseudouridine(55) synthase TruB [Proteobacteria bacterium]|nr:tRNA pseudouridine(55) synthase TruB [Pseudomonadota bacterium]